MAPWKAARARQPRSRPGTRCPRGRGRKHSLPRGSARTSPGATLCPCRGLPPPSRACLSHKFMFVLGPAFSLPTCVGATPALIPQVLSALRGDARRLPVERGPRHGLVPAPGLGRGSLRWPGGAATVTPGSRRRPPVPDLLTQDGCGF